MKLRHGHKSGHVNARFSNVKCQHDNCNLLPKDHHIAMFNPHGFVFPVLTKC